MPTEKRVTVTAIDEHIAIITDGIGPPQLQWPELRATGRGGASPWTTSSALMTGCRVCGA